MNHDRYPAAKHQPDRPRISRALALVMALPLMTGCSQSAATFERQSATSSPRPTAAASPEATPSTEPTADVSSDDPEPNSTAHTRCEPTLAEDTFQKGLQVYWHTNDERLESQAHDVMEYAKELHANSVGITFPFDVDGAAPTTVRAGAETPAPEHLRVVIAAAQERGLRTMLRPLMDEQTILDDDPTKWRGSITVKSPDQWFERYQTFLQPYLELAQDMCVDEFILGSELNSLQKYPQQWQELKDHAQKTYGGELSYSFNWNAASSKLSLDSLGIDMYPPVKRTDNASVNDIADDLSTWLRTQKATIGGDITVDEAGIPAQPGLYSTPWRWGNDRVPVTDVGEQTQAKWFAAAALAAERESAGIYYWMVDSNLDTANPPSSPGSFIGRPAEQAIKDAYRE
ncbi:hypothetical protein CR983_01165 [Candidatus Saccharibacteria bacterium]|nr:MAG: hypothetical protein CR983_01165 [Candidatus Saccharibacteria bacterium]